MNRTLEGKVFKFVRFDYKDFITKACIQSTKHEAHLSDDVLKRFAPNIDPTEWVLISRNDSKHMTKFDFELKGSIKKLISHQEQTGRREYMIAGHRYSLFITFKRWDSHVHMVEDEAVPLMIEATGVTEYVEDHNGICKRSTFPNYQGQTRGGRMMRDLHMKVSSLIEYLLPDFSME